MSGVFYVKAKGVEWEAEWATGANVYGLEQENIYCPYRDLNPG
jgi:hypothetical protein